MAGPNPLKRQYSLREQKYPGQEFLLKQNEEFLVFQWWRHACPYETFTPSPTEAARLLQCSLILFQQLLGHLQDTFRAFTACFRAFWDIQNSYQLWDFASGVGRTIPYNV